MSEIQIDLHDPQASTQTSSESATASQVRPIHTPGYRLNGEFPVFEWLTAKSEKLGGTLSYLAIDAERRAALVAQNTMRYARGTMELPAKLLFLFTWKRHLLTLSARTSIALYGAILAAIIMVDVWAWTCTFAMIGTASLAKVFVIFALASLNALVDRSIIVSDLTARGLIPSAQLQRKILSPKGWGRANAVLDVGMSAFGRVFSSMGVNLVLRLLIIAVMAKTNGEAIRLVLSEPETQAIAQEQDEQIAQRLRTNRSTTIETEIARRDGEAGTETQASLRAWNEERTAARISLTRERETTTAAKRAEVERLERAMQGEMHGTLSGHTGVGPRVAELGRLHQDAQDDLRAYERETPRMLRSFDETTNRGRLDREEQLTQRRAQLNNEKDRRLNEARRARIEQLGTEAGYQASRPRGIWSRLDALAIVHQRSESSRHGDWFVQIVLFGIGLLPLLAKRLGNSDVKTYYSLRAHAEVNDGSAMCLKAQSVYREVLRQDNTIVEFMRRWDAVCALANTRRDAWHLKINEIGKARDGDKLALTKAAVDTLTIKAWDELKLSESMADISNLMLVAHIASLGFLEWSPMHGRDIRGLVPVLTMNELISTHGWTDSSRDRRIIEEKRTAHMEAQDALLSALETFRIRFGVKVRPEARDGAGAFYTQIISPLVQDLNQLDRFFQRRSIVATAWLNGQDPRTSANLIAAQVQEEPSKTSSPADEETPLDLRPLNIPTAKPLTREDTLPSPDSPVRHLRMVPKPTT